MLRKMIEAGSGMPPSVLGAQAFWATLHEVVQAWARGVFKAEIELSLKSRRVVSGEECRAALVGRSAFTFGAGEALGVRAISLDERGAMENAAIRLGETPSGPDGVSEVLLRLLVEEPVKSLLSAVEGALSPDADRACADTSDNTGIVSGGRYIDVRYAGELNGEPLSVSLAFEFEYVKALAVAPVQLAATSSSEKPGSETLRQSVRASRVSMSAVLDTLELTIAECAKLRAGDVLDLPSAEVERLRLHAETVNGSVDVGEGSLGAWRERRAVKLHGGLSGGFLQEVADL